VSSDDSAGNFDVGARDVMLATTGVDLRSIGWRWKFVFTAEIGRPEKAQYIVRDDSAPYEVFMDVLIRGWFSIQFSSVHSYYYVFNFTITDRLYICFYYCILSFVE